MRLIFAFICLLLKLSVGIATYPIIYDLAWSFGNDTIYFPGFKKFEFSKQIPLESNGMYSANEFCAAEHGGTHFDAPYHFYEPGWQVADVPVTRLFAKGALINITKDSEALGRNVELTVKHLQDWEKRNGQFESGTVLLVQFGRSKYWPDRLKYMELDDDNTTMNFPAISNEAAQWIVNTNKFYGVGLDTPSIDPGNTTDYFVHRIFAKNSLYNLENVKLLDNLPERGFDLVVAPMKIEGGTGAPVRIFAKVRDPLLWEL